MSRRTANSNKAILEAWNRERELVKEGKGTREWTCEQQKDIIEKGKAYDEDGVAFQGQHMKSVEKYPEYQGEIGNIQFLTRAEHLEAHNGNWRNSTNWYFDPITKEKIDFGDGLYIPCKIIQLQISIVNVESNAKIETTEIEKEKYISKNNSYNKNESNIKSTIKNRFKKCIIGIFDFCERHPIITSIASYVVVEGGRYLIGEKILKDSHSKLINNINNNKTTHSKVNNTLLNDNGVSLGNENISSSNMSNDEKLNNDGFEGRPYTPNDVPEGKQRYHYRDGSIKWKDKPSYHRGANSDE